MKNFSTHKAAQILSVAVGFVMILSPFVALAQFTVPCVGGFGVPCHIGNNSLTDTILRIIQILLGLAGLVAVLILIIGGFRYITSFGNEETTGEAKKMILNAIIGIVIIILSFVIVQVVSSVANRGVSTGTV
jgi:hypothetical protein